MKPGIINQKSVERSAMTFMVLGIVFLCQPWIEFLHVWSVLIMLIGIIGFNVSAHMRPVLDEARVDEDDTGPVSLTATVQRGHNG
ncbi:MAG: hypothetical protein ABL879_15735 [Devosia sp.]